MEADNFSEARLADEGYFGRTLGTWPCTQRRRFSWLGSSRGPRPRSGRRPLRPGRRSATAVIAGITVTQPLGTHSLCRVMALLREEDGGREMQIEKAGKRKGPGEGGEPRGSRVSFAVRVYV